jgi:chromosome segregation ATPase
MADIPGTDTERRRQLIAEAAYYRAEKRGFDGGDPAADWTEAEKEIDARLQRSDWRAALEHLDSQLSAANEKLMALKKKVRGTTSDARKEWGKDLDKLAELRDKLEKRLEELRAQGDEAGQRARKRAEKVWKELSEALRRATAPHD